MATFPYTWFNLSDGAKGQLASAIDSTQTSFNVGSGQGATFPASNFVVRCESERILVGTRTNDAFSGCTRAFDGSSGVAHAAGVMVFQSAGKTLFQRIYDQITGHTHAKAEVTDLGVSVARVTANRTTTSTSFSDVTDLTIALGTSQTWKFESTLSCGCSSTGGSQYTVTVPTGSTLRLLVQGNTSSATAWTGISITTSGANTVTVCTANAQGRIVFMSGTVVTAGTAGNLQVRFRSITAGQTSTCDVGSYLSATRL